MKKIVFTLVLLVFASSALADVNITAAQVGDTNEVIISWDATGETNLVRAFGINIQLDNDVNIISINGLSADYWVYPGTIQIAADGEITFMGSIGAEYGDLPSDTLAGPPDGNGVTVEAASLYAPVGPGSPNAPVKFGDLASIIVSDSTCLSISANVSRAGATGVVMENPDEVVTVNYPAVCVPVVILAPEVCNYGGPQADEWATVGEPECWCAENNPRQCHGDAVGDAQGRYNYWVGTNDLNVFVAAWNKSYADIAGLDYAGTPLICADIDHLPEGRYSYRVSANDLNIFVANYNQANAPNADCP